MMQVGVALLGVRALGGLGLGGQAQWIGTFSQQLV